MALSEKRPETLPYFQCRSPNHDTYPYSTNKRVGSLGIIAMRISGIAVSCGEESYDSLNGKSGKSRKEQIMDKKIGARSSDPNRYSQPRLPGSVVGEASMRWGPVPGKITKVSVLG